MTAHRITIAFIGVAGTAVVPPGGSLLRAAQQAGIEIVSTCGARGRCRSCRIKVVTGVPPPPTLADRVQLGDEEVREGYRLSCQYEVSEDVTVQVAPPLAESAFQILVQTERGRGEARLELDSGVRKVHGRPTPPTDENHQTSDLDEVFRGTGSTAADQVGLDVLRQAPALLRGKSDGLTVTTFDRMVMALEAGDTREQIYGMAFDIGTTTVVGYLIDLTSGETLATVSSLNPQTVYGGDLMSRIAFAMDGPANLRKLHIKIVRLINEQIAEACATAKVPRDRVYKLVVVGNTCMHHLFLGIDPTFVGQAPYAPAMRQGYRCAARKVGVRANYNAKLFLLPLVAGFVGADTMGMILSTRIYDSQDTRVTVDIGTNGEVVMGGRDKLMACSAPAGPALEGAQIKSGMRGALGAIDKVRIDDDVVTHAIGGVPPIGICGSGLIDAVAALLDAGVVEPSGRMLTSPKRPVTEAIRRRLREDELGMRECVVAWASETGDGKDLVVTQADIRQVQLAKAAIASGVTMLQQVMGVPDERIAELMLAGGFGNYLNIRSARRIGIIPDLPPSRVRYVGNAAGLGAQMALLSETERRRADHLAQQVEHVSLASHPDFQQIFLKAVVFPAAIAEYPNA